MKKTKLTLKEKRKILKRIAKRYHFDIIEPYDLESYFERHHYTLIGELKHHRAGEYVCVHTSFVNAAFPKIAAIISPNESLSSALKDYYYVKDLNKFIKDKELATIVDF